MKKIRPIKIIIYIFYLITISIITYFYPLYLNYNTADKLHLFLVSAIIISSIISTLIFINDNIKISLINIFISNTIIAYVGNRAFNVFISNNLYFAIEDQDIWAWENGKLLIYMFIYMITTFLICIILRKLIKIIIYFLRLFINLIY